MIKTQVFGYTSQWDKSKDTLNGCSNKRHEFTKSRNFFELTVLLLPICLALHVHRSAGQGPHLDAVFWAAAENSRNTILAESPARVDVWGTVSGSWDTAYSFVWIGTWQIWLNFIGFFPSTAGKGGDKPLKETKK